MMDHGRSKWFGSEIGDRRAAVGRTALLLALLVALCAVHSGGEPLRQALRYERSALAAGQWWRLFGAHLVHLDLRHLLFNLAGLILLWLLFAREFRAWQWLVIMICATLAVDAGLWFGSPQVAWYVGASGALHGLWSAGGWAQWRRGAARGALPLLALLLKLGVEQWRGASMVVADIPVILQAHLYGALGGLILPLIQPLTARPRPL